MTKCTSTTDAENNIGINYLQSMFYCRQNKLQRRYLARKEQTTKMWHDKTTKMTACKDCKTTLKKTRNYTAAEAATTRLVAMQIIFLPDFAQK